MGRAARDQAFKASARKPGITVKEAPDGNLLLASCSTPPRKGSVRRRFVAHLSPKSAEKARRTQERADTRSVYRWEAGNKVYIGVANNALERLRAEVLAWRNGARMNADFIAALKEAENGAAVAVKVHAGVWDRGRALHKEMKLILRVKLDPALVSLNHVILPPGPDQTRLRDWLALRDEKRTKLLTLSKQLPKGAEKTTVRAWLKGVVTQ